MRILTLFCAAALVVGCTVSDAEPAGDPSAVTTTTVDVQAAAEYAGGVDLARFYTAVAFTGFVGEVDRLHREQVAAEQAAREADAARRAERERAKATAPTRESIPSGSSSGANWSALAQCESGGNWAHPPVGSHGYSGGLMFLPSTWRAYGGTQYAPAAHLASKAQQIAVAEKVLADVGRGAWPGCTAAGRW